MNTTAIVIVDHGSRRAESNRLLEEVARLFGNRFAQKYDIVEPAHMELDEPSLATAYRACVTKGAKQVVIVPFFLVPASTGPATSPAWSPRPPWTTPAPPTTSPPSWASTT